MALVDSLPAGVTFVDATNGGTETGGVVTWTTFSLASGATRTDTVRVVATADGTQENVARVSSSATDADASDDRVALSTSVAANADLGVTKTLAAPASPVAGDTLVYVIVTTNAGPSGVTDVTLLDSLPIRRRRSWTPPTAARSPAAW